MYNYFSFLFFFNRAKIFRGKKIHGDYEIKVEQVRDRKSVKTRAIRKYPYTEITRYLVS